MTLLSPELEGWFPANELRAHYELKEHTLTRVEKVLFGFREDGSEGLCCPTQPQDHALKRANRTAAGEEVTVQIGDDDE